MRLILFLVLPGNKTAFENASDVMTKLQTGGVFFDFNTKIEIFTDSRN
jgi:hypothetical protein